MIAHNGVKLAFLRFHRRHPLLSMNILFASSELYPLIKTGGLADVSGQLPRALRSHGVNIRVILPGYRAVLQQLRSVKTIASLTINQHSVTLQETHIPNSQVKLWLVDCPALFDRPYGPYQDQHGNDWPDNAERFGVFAKTICAIALGATNIDWQADIVHCNDWQTGLVPALLQQHSPRPASVFSIHNLAYQGLFTQQEFIQLRLPNALWNHHALEFYGQLSFIKGGLVFADEINTVSPRYAQEIQTPTFGCGLEELLQHRANNLHGILNGIDTKAWNPNTDANIAQTYNKRSLAQKSRNKIAAQAAFDLPQDAATATVVMVGRLTEQKGVDLVLEALPQIRQLPVQLLILGTGTKTFEAQLKTAAAQYPEQLSVMIDYNETLAHLLIAGADLFLMPSRFEPCGLTQLYSLRYGTVPIVRNVGGLVNTVSAAKVSDKKITGTGIVVPEDTPSALLAGLFRALTLYYFKPDLWRQLQLNGMQQDFSWKRNALGYVELYERLLAKTR